MGPVAEGTVFGHRGVLPQEGPALFLVTTQAIIIEGYLVQGGLAQAPVRVMAVVTGSFTLGNRVAGGQVQLRTHLRVAVQAHLLRLIVVQGEVALLVGVVAVIAGQVLLLVLTAGPQQLISFFMATLAACSACFDIGHPLRAKAHVGWVSPPAAIVGLAGPMASGTGGAAATLQATMGGLEHRVDRGVGIICVAVKAAWLFLFLRLLRRQTASDQKGTAQ